MLCNRIQGFTLVEVLVAMVILMIGLIPAIMFLGRAPALERAESLFVASSLIHLETERAFYTRKFVTADTTYTLSGPWKISRQAEPGPLVSAEIGVERLGKEVTRAKFLLFAGPDSTAALDTATVQHSARIGDSTESLNKPADTLR